MVSKRVSVKPLIFHDDYKKYIDCDRVKPTYISTSYVRVSMMFLEDIPGKTNITKHQLGDDVGIDGGQWSFMGDFHK